MRTLIFLVLYFILYQENPTFAKSIQNTLGSLFVLLATVDILKLIKKRK
jgi:hypothetical protein